MKNDKEQLLEDVDKDLKFVGKEIFGNTEVLQDIESFFKKISLN